MDERVHGNTFLCAHFNFKPTLRGMILFISSLLLYPVYRNTFAVWNSEYLSRTGFIMVSDGIDGTIDTGGVEVSDFVW